MSLLFLVAFLLSVFVYGAARGAEAAIKAVIRTRRSLVLFLDHDSGKYALERVKGLQSQFHKKWGNRDMQYIRSGQARYMGNMGALNIIHPRHGWNMRGLTDEETVGQSAYLRTLAISDPASYYLAIQRNEAQDALNANQEAEHWIAKIAPFALVALIVTMGGVMFLVYKLQGVS